MRVAFALLALLPLAAQAEQQVPALQIAGDKKVVIPAGLPPKPILISPDPKLSAKDAASATAGATWRNKAEKPIKGPDGSVLWSFGHSLPSIVCAVLQSCDLGLEPGEIINNIEVGDKTRWNIALAISGAGATRAMHLNIKPMDAGLITSLQVYTDRRLYSVRLVSTGQQWTAKTAFLYPEEGVNLQNELARARQEFRTDSKTIAVSSVDPANLSFLDIDGDKPSWRPERAYSDGRKTYIDFPSRIETMSAPVLVELGDDGDWFSSPTEQVITYRMVDNKMIVDAVLDRAALIRGVGHSRQKVTLSRRK